MSWARYCLATLSITSGVVPVGPSLQPSGTVPGFLLLSPSL
jgi:hypothetical protein